MVLTTNQGIYTDPRYGNLKEGGKFRFCRHAVSSWIVTPLAPLVRLSGHFLYKNCARVYRAQVIYSR